MEFDIIGTMYDGEVALAGWHVNSLQPILGAEDFEVYPNSPSRVYAGEPKQCYYVFDSEAHFKEITGAE